MVGTILLFIAVLSLLVFVHEFGHFWMAKRMGMAVKEFGFGFPPRIFGIKKGDTLYSINWIPLGGFVRIKGESGEERDAPDSFASKSALARFSVLIAGITMNIALAAVLLGIGFMIGLPSVISDDLPAGANVRDEALRVVQVLPDSPADTAGIKNGDTLISIDDRVFETSTEANEYIGAASGSVNVVLERGEGEFVQKEISRAEVDGQDREVIGVALVKTGFVSYGFFQAIYQGVVATVDLTIQIIVAFASLIGDLVTKAKVDVDLSGPVGIAVMTGEVANLGLVYLIQFTAVLSLNLAVINVLPFPALDGGRILFLLIEKVIRRKVSPVVEAVTHNLGFVFLLGLVVLVTYRDIVQYGGEIFSSLGGLF